MGTAMGVALLALLYRYERGGRSNDAGGRYGAGDRFIPWAAGSRQNALPLHVLLASC